MFLLFIHVIRTLMYAESARPHRASFSKPTPAHTDGYLFIILTFFWGSPQSLS